MDLIEIYRAQDEYEAAIIGGVLEDAGIQYENRRAGIERIIAAFANGLGEHVIMIRAEDHERAIDALAQARKAGDLLDEASDS